jgi:hypothetical protein
MNLVTQNLLKLQAIEFGEVAGSEKEIQDLRAIIPQPMLGHYDRLRAREKKGVAVIRNQTCTGCYMRQPVGKITVLMRGDDIQLCDSCGRYLYLPDVTEQEAAAKAAAEKPAKAEKKAKTPKAEKAPRKKKTTPAAS